jgi:hypothetical protein
MTKTKERPILFRPELVRKVLEGKKTQTRRPLGVLPFGAPSVIAPHDLDDGRYGFFDDEDGTHVCKFGRPGDVMWVRETFLKRANGAHVVYAADMDRVEAAGFGAMYGGWKPSIHMPKEACRLRLEITEVRVERIRDISEADAVAEGVEYSERTGRYIPGSCDYAQWSFGILWNAAYPGSWERNDFVWVISFKVIP